MKRARVDDEDDLEGPASKQIAIASANGGKSKGLVRSIKRTSGLQAPIISLTGAHGVRNQAGFVSSTNEIADAGAHFVSG